MPKPNRPVSMGGPISGRALTVWFAVFAVGLMALVSLQGCGPGPWKPTTYNGKLIICRDTRSLGPPVSFECRDTPPKEGLVR